MLRVTEVSARDRAVVDLGVGTEPVLVADIECKAPNKVESKRPSPIWARPAGLIFSAALSRATATSAPAIPSDSALKPMMLSSLVALTGGTKPADIKSGNRRGARFDEKPRKAPSESGLLEFDKCMTCPLIIVMPEKANRAA
jgi:hypothetical protein